jgi:quinol-cytochrome oxidoreductase complex cytochrome b subunit
VSQQNFDSQWIATQGKDGLNAVGIGSFFNTLDFGQMYTFHVVLLPVVVVMLAVWHVLLVRHRGVVPPYPARDLAFEPIDRDGQ